MPYRPHATPARRGFTLIEAMLAILVVAVGSASILPLIYSMRTANTIEQERARAHQVVADQMERVRQQLYSLVTAGQQVQIWDNGTPDNTADDTQGTLVVRITDPESGALLASVPTPARRVQVEVTLSWHPRGRLSDRTFRESVMGYIAP